MYSTETISVILGIFVLWGCFRLYEEYLWFRVITATCGIGLTLLVPIASTYLAYISFFEENSLWLAITQLILGWSFLAIAFWYSIGTYIKFMKETFDKTENLTSSNKISSEIKSKMKFSEKGKKWINDVKEDVKLNDEEKRKRILFGLLSRERFHEPRTVPLNKKEEDIMKTEAWKKFSNDDDDDYGKFLKEQREKYLKDNK